MDLAECSLGERAAANVTDSRKIPAVQWSEWRIFFAHMAPRLAPADQIAVAGARHQQIVSPNP
jgi:hypothetical protein